jgi:hypothetical protein
MSTSLDETSSLRKIVGSLTETFPKNPLVQGRVDSSLRASHSKVIRRYGTSESTLSKSESIRHNLVGTRDSHVDIDHFQ